MNHPTSSLNTTTFLLFLFLSFGLACKKDVYRPGWQGTLSVDMDGVPTRFLYDIDISINKPSLAKEHTASISGRINEHALGDQLEVMFLDSLKPITKNMHSDDGSTGSRGVRLLFDPLMEKSAYMNAYSMSYPAIAVIDSLTDSYIKGSFSGQVFLLEYQAPNWVVGSKSKTLTNGKFEFTFR